MNATPAFTRSCWLAGALWLFAGVLTALFVVRGPADADGIDMLFGLAAGLGWPLHVATGDMDRVRLQRIVPLPETAQLVPGHSIRFALGMVAVAAAALTVAFAVLPGDAVDISVSGLAVAVTLALATTGRAAQLWWWEQRHPGQRLFDVRDGPRAWVASGALPVASEAEMAFGQRRRLGATR